MGGSFAEKGLPFLSLSRRAHVHVVGSVLPLSYSYAFVPSGFPDFVEARFMFAGGNETHLQGEKEATSCL